MTPAPDWLRTTLSPEQIRDKYQSIHAQMLHGSRHLREGNFQAISADDLAQLFTHYDQHYFQNKLMRSAVQKSEKAVFFRLSSTMTRASGKTILTRRRSPNGSVDLEYEIAIASRMLFMNFNRPNEEVIVTGMPCTNRLQALQRIMEHEMLHLAELVVWDKSSCSAQRFKTLAGNLFGHTQTSHQLITPREHAAVEYDIHVGSMVGFEFEGRQLIGKVNRIHHRATVLVEDPRGQRYSNGRRYMKYYVPLPALHPTK